jgi:Ca2+-binding RTX toxin-like protein
MNLATWLRPAKFITRRGRSASRRRLAVEVLEDRLAPAAIDFAAMAAGLDQSLNTVKSDLAGVDAINVLPIVNRPLANVPGVNGSSGIIAGFQTTLVNAVNAGGDVQQAIFQSLGPGSPLNVLGSTDDDPQITKQDVGFQLDADQNGVTIMLHMVRNVQDAHPGHTDFGLGLPGVPLVIATKGDTEVRVGYDLGNLVFGVHGTNHYFFNAGGANLLKVDVQAGIPKATAGAPMTGFVGFLPITAADTATPTNLSVEFTTHLNDSGHLTNPEMTGQAAVNLSLRTNSDAQVAGFLSMPTITTDFVMSWSFNGVGPVNPNGPLSSFGNQPTVAFENITLDIGSALSTQLGPWLSQLNKALAPIEPAINVLTTPIPGVSDFEGQPTSLIDLATNFGLIPDSVREVVNLAKDIVQVSGDSSAVAAAVQDLTHNFGTLDLNASNGDPRNYPTMASYLNFGVALTNLVGNGLSSLSLADMENQIVSNLSGPTQQAAQDLFTFFDPNQNSHISIEFPLFSDPATTLINLFLGTGQDVEIVHARVEFPQQVASLNVEFPLQVGPVFVNIEFNSSVSFDAAFGIGYDAQGLRQFANDFLANPGSVDANDLLQGLLLDGDSHVSISGSLSGSAFALAPLVAVEGSGGLNATFALATDNPNSDAVIRLTDGPSCLFKTQGKIDYELSVDAQVTVFVPVFGIPTPFVYPYSYDSGDTVLLAMSDCIANPFAPPASLHLAQYDAQSQTLTLNMGPHASDRSNDPNIDPDFITDDDEVFTVMHDDDQSGNPNGGEALLVSSFGITQRFTDVKVIVADGGAGDDSVTIGKGVHADANLTGGNGNDQLTYLGDGNATVAGNDGDDKLTGGNGTNNLDGGAGNDTLNGGPGVNVLHGGPDNDILRGGGSNDSLYGDDGNDALFAGPASNLLDGGAGDDVLTAAAGSGQLIGGLGDDIFNWAAGDGLIAIDGGGGTDHANLAGTTADDDFNLSHNGATVNAQVPGDLTLSIANVEYLGIDGLAGADAITVNDLTGTGAREVDVDFVDLGMPDADADTIIINGTPGDDNFKISKTQVTVGHSEFPNGGVTDVLRDDFLVRTVNSADDVRVHGLDGGDTFNILGETGPTTIYGEGGADTFNVIAKSKEDVAAHTTSDYLGPLYLDGGTQKSTLKVDESPCISSSSTFLTTSLVYGNLLPATVSYQGAGGFGGGVSLITGPGNDSVNVLNTAAGVNASVSTGDGNDNVKVSSSAPALDGDLSGILGTLNVDVGAGAQNSLLLGDRLASAGNQNVQVTAGQVLGFAGPSDQTVVNYTATGGNLRLTLEGSTSPTLKEKFLVNGPHASITVDTNDGNDQVTLTALSQSATINTGAGDDTVTLDGPNHSLDSILAPVNVTGGAGADTINVMDQGAPAGHTYDFTAKSLARSGAASISFDAAVETLNLKMTAFTDVVHVNAMPAGPTVVLEGGKGADTLVGPPQTNVWQIAGMDKGTLNQTVRFSAIENLQGNTGDDFFVLANGVGVSGSLTGGGGSTNLLDYSAYKTPIQLDLDLVTSAGTNVPKFGGINQVVGGHTSDLLIAHSSGNLWQINGVNAGNLSTVAYVLGFHSFENLRGGPSLDDFQVSDAGMVTGTVDGGAGEHLLDYSMSQGAVMVNLTSGQATRIGKVLRIEDVTGGAGDDVLIGDAHANILHGGAGNNLLLGLAGDDQLFGGLGRDVLIGGAGADILTGGDGDNLLIGGITNYDAKLNLTALGAIMAQWTTNGSFTDKVSQLKLGVGPNQQYRLNSTTVHDDQAPDTLKGGPDADWFWAVLAGPKPDQKNDPGGPSQLN